MKIKKPQVHFIIKNIFDRKYLTFHFLLKILFMIKWSYGFSFSFYDMQPCETAVLDIVLTLIRLDPLKKVVFSGVGFNLTSP